MNYLRYLKVFFGIVFRQWHGERISISSAHDVAKIIGKKSIYE